PSPTLFSSHAPAPTLIYTLSLHDALPILLPAVSIEPLPEISLVVVQTDADERDAEIRRALDVIAGEDAETARVDRNRFVEAELGDRKSTRLNSSHVASSYAVFCLKKKIAK